MKLNPTKIRFKFLLVLFTVGGLFFQSGNIIRAQTIIEKRDPAIEGMVSQVSSNNIERIIKKLVGFHTRHTLSDTLSNKQGIGAARRWIKAELERYSKESGNRLQVSFDPFWVEADGRRIPHRVHMKNVLAILPASNPRNNRVIIVSGHYDSRASDVMDATSFAPGANDDASGTAVVMELARIMSHYQFSTTLIFAAVTGEEQGLYGSRHLAERARKEGWNVIAMITNDIVGNTLSSGTHLKDNTHLRVFSEGIPVSATAKYLRLIRSIGGENDSPSREFARYMKEVGERYVDDLEAVTIYRRDRFLRGGDHTPFNQLGFTAVRISEMNENFLHQHQNVRVENGVQYGDLPEFVDYAYVAQVARFNLAVLANLALAPPPPDSVGIVVRKLTNFTTLKWSAAKHGNPAGYYVLWRATDSAYWQHKRFVGKAHQVTLPYSKDNFFFAVQAVDSAGHESLPVFPIPMR